MKFLRISNRGTARPRADLYGLLTGKEGRLSETREDVVSTWQDLEREVRQLAEVIWGGNALAETINGVKCDCVLKNRSDYWVLVEISKENTLDKLRTDLAKFASIRPYLFLKNIYTECHFVTPEHFPSLRETGEGQNVAVHSPKDFFSKYLGSTQYLSERERAPFGSAVDPDSGETDSTSYVPIRYTTEKGELWGSEKIASAVASGKKIILLGEFGSGKSRCLMEIYRQLANSESSIFPLAINLRDNWGYKKFSHIIHNHLDSLGLGNFNDALVRTARRGMHPILIDGLDEISSQSWSGEPARLSEIRKGSMQGIRDLIAECKNAGMMLTGREHYFNSNEEMLECLGLRKEQVTILYCPSEFTDSELETYLQTRVKLETYPTWLPRKPLLCQLLTRIDKDALEALVASEIGEIKFFEKVLDAICAREAKIHPTIYIDALKNIMLDIATLSRTKEGKLGPITPAEIGTIFEQVTGAAPIDESAVVLQRLPYLGRTGSESGDRVFIDEYAVDGLRALALVKRYFSKDDSIKHQKWKHPLGPFGYKLLASKIKLDNESLKYFRNIEARGNSVACSDFVGSMVLGLESTDFQKININDGKFSTLDFSGRTIRNVSFIECEIEELTLDSYATTEVVFNTCLFDRIIGISSADGYPSFMTDCTAGGYENVLTVARISELAIADRHKTLLSILKKLFFQPGKGRKEEALLRGTEKYWDQTTAENVLRIMLRQGMVDRFKGDDGWVYSPNRAKTVRVKKIMSKLGNCGDELWAYV